MSLTQKLSIRFIRTKFALLSKVSTVKAAEKAFELFTSPQSRVKPDLSSIFKKADVLDVIHDGKKIRGYRWNHPAQKKLLILHGYESSAIYFDRYINPLVKKGYEVLAFDAPAHGSSEGKQIHALDYKKFIFFLIQKFGPITSFISHSFGGLGLSLALEELPHDETWKVVFIAPATESTTAMNQFFSYMKLNNEVRKQFDILIMNANQKPSSWYSVARAAAFIKASVLFLQDKDDNLTPYSDIVPIIEKNYPNFQFIISEGLGHSRIYRDAGTVKAVIRFL